MKRLCFFLTFLLCFPVFAKAAIKVGESQGYRYRVLKDGTAELLEYFEEKKGDNFIIPGTIDGYQVTLLGDSLFEDGSFKCVTVPEGVKSIGSRTFALCSQLSQIILPDSLTDIDRDAFFMPVKSWRV